MTQRGAAHGSTRQGSHPLPLVSVPPKRGVERGRRAATSLTRRSANRGETSRPYPGRREVERLCESGNRATHRHERVSVRVDAGQPATSRSALGRCDRPDDPEVTREGKTPERAKVGGTGGSDGAARTPARHPAPGRDDRPPRGGPEVVTVPEGAHDGPPAKAAPARADLGRVATRRRLRRPAQRARTGRWEQSETGPTRAGRAPQTRRVRRVAAPRKAVGDDRPAPGAHRTRRRAVWPTPRRGGTAERRRGRRGACACPVRDGAQGNLSHRASDGADDDSVTTAGQRGGRGAARQRG